MTNQQTEKTICNKSKYHPVNWPIRRQERQVICNNLIEKACLYKKSWKYRRPFSLGYDPEIHQSSKRTICILTNGFEIQKDILVNGFKKSITSKCKSRWRRPSFSFYNIYVWHFHINFSIFCIELFCYILQG